MNSHQFIIDSQIIGESSSCFIIAEIAQAHDGSLGLAHAYIDAASKAGANAVKFQAHLAAAESTYDEQFRVKFSKQDATRYDYWKRMEFTADQWAGLAAHAAEKKISFLCSVFSLQAFEMLNKLSIIPAWKIGSGEFKSQKLIEAMVETGKPVMFSSGMSKWEEIDQFANYLAKKNYPYALFQCTSMYPTPPELVGLNVLEELKNRYSCPVGLSDHSGKVFAPMAAMAQGANLLEIHITFDKAMFGPDVSSSITLDELALLTKARDQFFEMKSHPVDKDKVAESLAQTRNLFTKSLAPARKISSGEIITEAMLAEKKPGTGIQLKDINKIIGRRVVRDLMPEHLLRWEDIES